MHACKRCGLWVMFYLISTGALHGSILGPLLFFIFIHDLPKSSTFFYTRLYAGDKFTIDISWKWSRHLNFLWEISNHLQAVYEWLCNNIKLNLTKTKFLIFMSRQRKNHNLYPPLTVANVHLEKPFCVKYLGVYIDCHLIISWHDCIDYVCGKLSKNVSIMVEKKRHVSVATLTSLNYSLHPYLTFACSPWGNNYNARLSQIVKLENKEVCVINAFWNFLTLLNWTQVCFFKIISTMKSFLLYKFQ